MLPRDNTNKDFWAFFDKKQTEYWRNLYSWVLLCILEVAAIIRNTDRTLIIKAVLWILLTCILVNVIANIVRIYDIHQIEHSNSVYKKSTIATVKKQDNWEINGTYSIIYPKQTGYKFEIGCRYKLEYLYGTMGRYVINWEKIDENSNTN